MKNSHLLPLSFLPLAAQDDSTPRARDLGILFGGPPGPHNATTDVPGVKVGYATLIVKCKKLRHGAKASSQPPAFFPSPSSQLLSRVKSFLPRLRYRSSG